MLTNREIRKFAWRQMRGNWGAMIGAYFLSLIVSILPMLLTCFCFVVPVLFLGDWDISITIPDFIQRLMLHRRYFVAAAGLATAAFFCLLLYILSGTGLGIMKMFFRIVRGEKVKAADVFKGFRSFGHVLNYFFVCLISFLIQTAIMLPNELVGRRYGVNSGNARITEVITFIVLIVASIFINMAVFACAEKEERGPLASLGLSLKLMNGRWIKFYILMLSFFPWVFLSMLTLGIGCLILIPYQMAAQTIFFLSAYGEDYPMGEQGYLPPGGQPGNQPGFYGTAGQNPQAGREDQAFLGTGQAPDAPAGSRNQEGQQEGWDKETPQDRSIAHRPYEEVYREATAGVGTGKDESGSPAGSPLVSLNKEKTGQQPASLNPAPGNAGSAAANGPFSTGAPGAPANTFAPGAPANTFAPGTPANTFTPGTPANTFAPGAQSSGDGAASPASAGAQAASGSAANAASADASAFAGASSFMGSAGSTPYGAASPSLGAPAAPAASTTVNTAVNAAVKAEDNAAAANSSGKDSERPDPVSIVREPEEEAFPSSSIYQSYQAYQAGYAAGAGKSFPGLQGQEAEKPGVVPFLDTGKLSEDNGWTSYEMWKRKHGFPVSQMLPDEVSLSAARTDNVNERIRELSEEDGGSSNPNEASVSAASLRSRIGGGGQSGFLSSGGNPYGGWGRQPFQSSGSAFGDGSGVNGDGDSPSEKHGKAVIYSENDILEEDPGFSSRSEERAAEDSASTSFDRSIGFTRFGHDMPTRKNSVPYSDKNAAPPKFRVTLDEEPFSTAGQSLWQDSERQKPEVTDEESASSSGRIGFSRFGKGRFVSGSASDNVSGSAPDNVSGEASDNDSGTASDNVTGFGSGDSEQPWEGAERRQE